LTSGNIYHSKMICWIFCFRICPEKGVMEHWNIGFKMELSKFSNLVKLIDDGTIIPIFQYSIIPIISVMY